MSLMKQLLDHQLAQESARDGLAVILTLTNGTVMAGALRKGPVEGTYQLRTAGKKMVDGRPSSALEAIDVFLTSDGVHNFAVPQESRLVEPPRIALPGNGF